MTSSSKSAAEGSSANASTAVNADAAPVKRYSLFTAICLIVGICIGSGIFFKSDNILIATGGNVALGVAMMLLAATTIIFGGLTLARFAARTTGHGGLIAYAEEFLGPRRAAFIGWNFTFLRMPQSLAFHHMMPFEYTVSRMNPTLRFPVVSAMIALVTTLFWMGVHTVVSTLGLLPNGDISEVVVAMTMLILPLYYIGALRGALREDAPALTHARRAAAPAIALASSLAIGLSSISDSTRWPFVVAFTALLLVMTFALTPKRDA